MIKLEEVRKQYKNHTEETIEIIWMYLNSDEELRSTMRLALKRLSEDPGCIDFIDSFQGSQEDLRTLLAQI